MLLEVQSPFIHFYGHVSVYLQNGITPLMFAVKDSRVSIVERLLELGADLDETTKVKKHIVKMVSIFLEIYWLAISNMHCINSPLIIMLNVQ